MKYSFVNSSCTLLSVGVWFVTSAYFNVYSKIALNKVNLPWFMATVQALTGAFISVPLWYLNVRRIPWNSFHQFLFVLGGIIPVAVLSVLSNVAGTVSSAAGTVPFAQMLKSTEPIFTTVVSYALHGSKLSVFSCVALGVIVVGAAVSSLHELTFSWQALVAGSASNVFAALRSVASKRQMDRSLSSSDAHSAVHGDPTVTPENYYSVLTLASLVVLIPVTCWLEGPQAWSLLRSVVHSEASADSVAAADSLAHILASGVLFSVYNECSFFVLQRCSPVSHAVANTLRRLAVVGLAVHTLPTSSFSASSAAGCLLTVVGVLLYSLSRAKGSPRMGKTSR